MLMQNLSPHLLANNVTFIPVSAHAVVSADDAPGEFFFLDF